VSNKECFDELSTIGNHLFSVRPEQQSRRALKALFGNIGGAMARQLNPGDPFPHYRVPTANGRTLNIPADLTGEYAVIIFYRGIW
jgi:hypothetical protein